MAESLIMPFRSDHAQSGFRIGRSNAVNPKTRPAFALVFGIIVLLQQGTPAQSKPSRLILSMPGTPVADKLRPDDESVVVQRGDIISTFVDDRVLSVEQDLDERSQFADAIAVVESRGTNSYLIDNGEWIQSTLVLHSVRSLKERVPPVFDADGSTTVVYDGGELRIKGIRVRAGLHYHFKPGERYLVFLRARSTRVFFSGMQLRITSDDRIAPMHLSDGTESTAPSALYGISLKQIEAEIRSRLKQ
jgi:hypothetical protein